MHMGQIGYILQYEIAMSFLERDVEVYDLKVTWLDVNQARGQLVIVNGKMYIEEKTWDVHEAV